LFEVVKNALAAKNIEQQQLETSIASTSNNQGEGNDAKNVLGLMEALEDTKIFKTFMQFLIF